MLTPVDNPTAYGLVETDADSNILRFLEKPKPEEITCNTINAGIYVLEPDDVRPDSRQTSPGRSSAASFRRSSNAARRFSRRSIATTGSTSARRRNTCRCTATSWTGATRCRRSTASAAWRGSSPSARVDEAARLEGPLFIDEGCVVKAGARIGPYTVLGRHCQVDEDANVSGRHRLGRHAHRPRGRASSIPSSAAPETSAATPSVQRGVLGDKTPSPNTADYEPKYFQSLRRSRPLSDRARRTDRFIRLAAPLSPI